MNQDPNNPVAPSPIPTATDYSNPATAATPNIESFSQPSAQGAPISQPVATDATVQAPSSPVAQPSMPEAPTIDESLLQEAIADVPDEAAATTPETPSAVSIDDISTESAKQEVSPFANAAPTMDTSTADANTNQTNANSPAAITEENTSKNPPSVAFNDPAQQPDTKPHMPKKTPAIVEKIKANPVIAIIVAALVVIVALIVIIANV